MLTKSWPVLISAALVSVGGGESQVPKYPDVPPNAQNPIVLAVEGATVPQLTEIATKVVANQGLTMLQADTLRGIVETEQFEIESKMGAAGRGYPPAESVVFYVFASGVNPDTVMVTQIHAYYRPNPDRAQISRAYRVLVPTGHPGFVYALRLQGLLIQQLESDGVTITGQTGGIDPADWKEEKEN